MNNNALIESTGLADLLLSLEQKHIIETVTREINERPDAYNLDCFWALDSSIGGIGGYCMPFDPTNNPFPAGIGRSLFRPLQYAAANIEWNKCLVSAYMNTRSAVEFSGMHLETVTKYVIERSAPVLYAMKYRKSPLGHSVDFLEQRDRIPHDLIRPLRLCTHLYNKSKHDVNQDEERDKLFLPADALISYIAARILGKELLRPYYPAILRDLTPYMERLHNLQSTM